MKKIFWVTAAALFLFSCNNRKNDSGSDAVPTADAILLKLNLKPGDTFNQNMQSDISTVMEIMGQKTEAKGMHDINMKFTVKNVSADGDMSMDMTHAAVSGKLDMGPWGNDAAGVNAGIQQLIGAITGVTLTFSLDKEGGFTGMFGMEKLKAAFLRKADSLKLSKIAVEAISETFSEKNQELNTRMLFSICPNKPVKAGDKWMKEWVYEVNGIKMNIKDEYTLNKVEAGTAFVDLKSTSSSKDNINKDGMGVKMDVTLTKTGTYQLNITSGIVKNGRIDAKMEGVANSGGVKVSMNGSITYKISQ